MSHRNARLTVHGRRLLVDRVLARGMPVAHVARRWGSRVSARIAGLPGSTARVMSVCATGRRGRITCPPGPRAEIEQVVLAARVAHRRGQDWLGPELGVPARTVSRILRRHHVPRLAVCDPMTGEVIRASKTTAVRYERDRPGELVHMDVKKIGRIPDGGGWRAHGREMGRPGPRKARRIRLRPLGRRRPQPLRVPEILPDEKGATTAGFFARPLTASPATASHRRGHDRQRLDYTHSNELASSSSSRHRPPAHQAALPLAERQGRTLQPDPSDRMGLPASSPPTPNAPPRLHPGSSTTTLAAATAHSEASPDQPAVTNLMAGYT